MAAKSTSVEAEKVLTSRASHNARGLLLPLDLAGCFRGEREGRDATSTDLNKCLTCERCGSQLHELLGAAFRSRDRR